MKDKRRKTVWNVQSQFITLHLFIILVLMDRTTHNKCYFIDTDVFCTSRPSLLRYSKHRSQTTDTKTENKNPNYVK